MTLRKTAEEAKRHWRDEESNSAFFNEDGDRERARWAGAVPHAGSYGQCASSDRQCDDGNAKGGGRTTLNRSFSGTY